MLSRFAQVALVFPNNDPVMFMVAFYGCLLAELVPVPIEVPLTRKVTSHTHIQTHTHIHMLLLSVYGTSLPSAGKSVYNYTIGLFYQHDP